ncbi:hypothetical protein EV144_103554 [Flavobacterium sp. 270]|nr:hypothetical protein EV144_103554 [Flavobacterium sp. 270]
MLLIDVFENALLKKLRFKSKIDWIALFMAL